MSLDYVRRLVESILRIPQQIVGREDDQLSAFPNGPSGRVAFQPELGVEDEIAPACVSSGALMASIAVAVDLEQLRPG